MLPVSAERAKSLILSLIDAGADGALVDNQDGGVHVDIVISRIKGHENEPMSLEESESRMDAAIRKAWLALTGKHFPKKSDPVEFLNS